MTIPEASASTAPPAGRERTRAPLKLNSALGHGWIVIGGLRLRDYRSPQASPRATPKGRTGTCNACGGEVSGRADRLYCSDTCSKRARRKSVGSASAASGHHDCLSALLASARYLIGPVSHVSDLRGLLVPRAHALQEINARLPASVTEVQLRAAMKAEGILDYGDTVPEAAKGLRRR